MSDVAVVSPLPIQVLDPVTDGSMDELHATLVPVPEEDLPQGVVDLLTALIQRHRLTTQTGHAEVWQSLTTAPGTADAVHDKALPSVPVATLYPQATRPIQHPSPQLMASVDPAVDRVEMPVQGTVGEMDASPRPIIQPSGLSIERVPSAAAVPMLERVASASESAPSERVTQRPNPPAADQSLPETLQLPPGTARHAVSVLPPSAPASPALLPIPVPEVMLETLPGKDRGLLQVPFNKGSASGQVTISRGPDEQTRSLQISPSNALVFDQLKEPFEQIREPVWRLTDSGGEQQRQGSQQSPEDEQSEQPEHLA
jgi:hypothetical protein